MSHRIQQRQRFQPPELYSIHRGSVSRIEPYGCFVKLHTTPLSGLVHISQLHNTKVENVNDVVSLEDEVWVKVMDVQVEQIEGSGEDGGGFTRQRHKVKLSMKYVNQDNGEDLDEGNEQLEQDMARSGGAGRGRGGGGDFDKDGTGGANSMLGRALASNIGMSSAIDPGSLILKGKSGGGAAANSAQFNGYALVGEEEGEIAPTPAANVGELKQPAAAVVRPMGRGRGTTLPAWMTRANDAENKLGSLDGPNDANKDDDGSVDSRKREGRSRKRDKNSKKKDSARHRHHKKHKKHKDRRSRRRSRSPSYSSQSSTSSHRSRSRSRSFTRRKKTHKHSSKHDHRRRRDRSYSRSRSRSNDDGRSNKESEFANVDEARAVLERLERQRRGR
eukprot:g13189.t1.1.5e17418b g13189  g13189.t1 contig8:114374-115540(-)